MTDWCAVLDNVIALESGRGLFADCGAWHGYCRAGDHLEVRELVDFTPLMRIECTDKGRAADPIDRIETPGLRLGFAHSRAAILEIRADRLRGTCDRPSAVKDGTIAIRCATGVLQTRILGPGRAEADGGRWILRGETNPFHVIQTFEPGRASSESGNVFSGGIAVDPARVFEHNRIRWNRYLEPLVAPQADPAVRRLIARSVATLIYNWRTPTGGIEHAGVIPSPFAYRGFWAWDSWKHARALSLFEPELARDQVRAMFGEEPREIAGAAEAAAPPELDEQTPHYLNPEVLRGREAEIDVAADEVEEATEEEPVPVESPDSEAKAQQLESVLNQGLAFLSSLSQMAGGKPLFEGSGKKSIEVDRETGEVVMRFKLPGV